MLDHLIATKRNIAERYMLGELSPAEREKFEEHYFNCTECAEDVRDFLAISSNSRPALPDDRITKSRPQAGTDPEGWFQAFRFWRPAGLRDGDGPGPVRSNVLPPSNPFPCAAS